jgi:hypothetical protein
MVIVLSECLVLQSLIALAQANAGGEIDVLNPAC